MDFSNDFDVLDSFVNETVNNIDKIEFILLRIERKKEIKNSEMINLIFRAAHSIKAGANLLNFNEIEKSAHKIENFLDELRKMNSYDINYDYNKQFFEIDKIRSLVDDIEL